MARALNTLTNLFPLWVTLGAILALFFPHWFTWFDKPLIIGGLAVIMLGMGITLTFDDFRNVLKMPAPIAIGFGAQFCIMPFLGWGIAELLQLPRDFIVGLILVSCCPGGTASNVVTYIARANLPLSLLMTMCSTLVAVVFTPLLAKWLAAEYVDIDAYQLFKTTAMVVLAPVMLGLLLNQYFPRLVKTVRPASPLVAVLAIVLICASIIGKNNTAVINHAGVLVPAVLLLHLFAFALGWLVARLFGCDILTQRTISIEVDMQNSGLGTALAAAHLADRAKDPLILSPTPCAISAVMHSIIGSILAALWRGDAERVDNGKPHSIPYAIPNGEDGS